MALDLHLCSPYLNLHPTLSTTTTSPPSSCLTWFHVYLDSKSYTNNTAFLEDQLVLLLLILKINLHQWCRLSVLFSRRLSTFQHYCDNNVRWSICFVRLSWWCSFRSHISATGDYISGPSPSCRTEEGKLLSSHIFYWLHFFFLHNLAFLTDFAQLSTLWCLTVYVIITQRKSSVQWFPWKQQHRIRNL